MSKISHVWVHIQTSLFPFLEEKLGPLSEKEKKFAAVLELIRIEDFVPVRWWHLGRPPMDRVALAKSFVAKMVYNSKTTSDIIERLSTASNLRLLCGWQEKESVPSESTFSRAFAEFAKSGLAGRVHEALIKEYESERVVGHISRDATDIVAREKATAGKPKKKKPKRKRGRPQKGEVVAPPDPTRLDKQLSMTLDEMLDDLPKPCDWGTKKKNGKVWHWKGYKLHVDWADGEIPISAVLTSASPHDSQAAIPLATMSAGRVNNFYDLMDSGYDADQIKDHSISLGHIPIIDHNKRGGTKREMAPATKRRYDERSTAERGFSLLKENFCGCDVMVRGHEKVKEHLMFGLLVLAAERLLNLLT